jgi:hypothetical protein
MPELGYVGDGERVYTADTLDTALELATWCQNANWVETAGVAPQPGLEPGTLRLTAGCSTIELLRNTERKNARGKND